MLKQKDWRTSQLLDSSSEEVSWLNIKKNTFFLKQNIDSLIQSWQYTTLEATQKFLKIFDSHPSVKWEYDQLDTKWLNIQNY